LTIIIEGVKFLRQAERFTFLTRKVGLVFMYHPEESTFFLKRGDLDEKCFT